MGWAVKTELLDCQVFSDYTTYMSDKNIYEARMAVFDYFVDTLVDLADPEDDDKELTIDDMIQVVNILFEGISMEVVSYDGETITFTAKV